MFTFRLLHFCSIDFCELRFYILHADNVRPAAFSFLFSLCNICSFCMFRFFSHEVSYFSHFEFDRRRCSSTRWLLILLYLRHHFRYSTVLRYPFHAVLFPFFPFRKPRGWSCEKRTRQPVDKAGEPSDRLCDEFSSYMKRIQIDREPLSYNKLAGSLSRLYRRHVFKVYAKYY